MAMSTGTSNTLLEGLAVLAVGTSGYAIWSVQQPPETSEWAVQAETLSPTDDDAAVGTATTDPTADDGTESTAEPTRHTEQAPQATVEDWVGAWSGDEADLLVVGDGYSNLPTQWVQEWGGRLGEDRSVSIHHWGEADDESFADPVDLSDAGDPALTIWSASRDGSTVSDAAERVDGFVEASTGPDAVLVSLGLSSEDEDIDAALDDLVEQLPDVPLLVSVGPGELYEPGVGDAFLEWAQDNADRAAVIDLSDMTGTPTAEEWAAAFDAALAEQR